MDGIYKNLWSYGDAWDTRKYIYGARSVIAELKGTLCDEYEDLTFLYNIAITKSEIEHDEQLQAFKRDTENE